MKKTILLVFIIAFVLTFCAPRKVTVSTAKPGNEESYLKYMARGASLLEQKKFDEAIGELRQASTLKPDSDKVHNYLGIAYFMKKNLSEAQKCFQKALEINPASAAAYCNLGSLQFKEGKVDLALETLRQAIATLGDHAALHFNLGTILLHKGEIDQGFAHLQKVMELDPGYLDQKRSFSLEAVESSPSQPEIFFRYARLYAAAGNLEKTLQYLDKAKTAGFKEWKRIRQDNAFIPLRDDPQVKKYFD